MFSFDLYVAKRDARWNEAVHDDDDDDVCRKKGAQSWMLKVFYVRMNTCAAKHGGTVK